MTKLLVVVTARQGLPPYLVARGLLFLLARGAPPPLARARGSLRLHLARTFFFRSRWFASLVDHIQSHRARRAADGSHRRVDRLAIQVRELQLRDLLHLLRGDGADLALVRLARSLRDVRRALEQHGRRRRLRDER